MEINFWETFLVVIGLLLATLGVIGAILPVMPGIILAIIGLLVYQFVPGYTSSWFVFGLFAFFSAVGILMDYTIPAMGAKKMGGSKWGIRGTLVGMVVGIFFAPFGLVSIIVMPFLGAFVGEVVFNKSNHKSAFKAALGSFFGFLVTTGYSFILCCSILGYMLFRLSQNIY